MSSSEKHLIACHFCDQLMYVSSLNKRQQSLCPRCQSPMESYVNPDLSAPFAYSLTGLILVIPSNLLPIMTLSMVGKSNANTLINGATQLWEAGYLWMSFLVLLCSILAPVLLLLTVFTICFMVWIKAPRDWLIYSLRFHHSIKLWAMVDVYMLGMLVAYSKLVDLGAIELGGGLYSFLGMWVMFILVNYSFDPQAVWRRLQS